jgi:hypothetical protein
LNPAVVYGYAMAGKSLQHELGKKKPFESPEKEGFVTRTRCDRDGRAVHVDLTTKAIVCM